jgi:hypothetical protein
MFLPVVCKQPIHCFLSSSACPMRASAGAHTHSNPADHVLYKLLSVACTNSRVRALSTSAPTLGCMGGRWSPWAACMLLARSGTRAGASTTSCAAAAGARATLAQLGARQCACVGGGVSHASSNPLPPSHLSSSPSILLLSLSCCEGGSQSQARM